MINKRIHLSPPIYEQGVLPPIALHGDIYETISKDILDFETGIKEYLETEKEVVALNSGTSAIHIALILAGVQKGDIVLCQSMTFVACANPILYQGAVPVFIDSEEKTWNMSPKFLKEAYDDCCKKGKTPKAIIVTSLYGMSSDMAAILAFAKAKQIPIVEDSAEALGGSYQGQRLSTLGDYGVLSFNLNKIITTGGGGVLIVNSIKEKEKAIFLATQAKEKRYYYHHKSIGYNYRIGHLNAVLGIIQLKTVKSNLLSRKLIFQFYCSLFEKIEGISMHKEPSEDYLSSHWLTALIVDSSKTGGITREDLRLALKKDNIESRPLWKPMHLQPLFKDSLYYGSTVSENLFNNGLCLPSGSNLTDSDKSRIENVIFNLLMIR